jgi:molecular chaperone DnaJ
VTFQQGFFSVARTCGRCRGSGRMIATPCKTCGGQGHVTVEKKIHLVVPAGVDTDSHLQYPGEGEPGSGGGPPGDLYIVVRAGEHPFFRREGTSVFCEVPVNFSQAALGASLEVPTPDGSQAKLTIPEGTQTGTTFRIRGQGIARVGSKGRGDLHVTVRVVVPSRLSSEQRKLVEQLGKTLPVPEARSKDKDKTILDRMKDILG